VRFAFTEQQLELRSAVRSVLERQCTAGDLRALADLRRSGGRAHGDPGRAAARWAVLCELGAPGLCVPVERGGLGLGDVDMVGVAEEAGWAALPEPLAESAALAAPLLAGAASGSPEASRAEVVAADALPALAAGELVATVGGVEPTASGPVPTDTPEGERGAVVTPRVSGASRAGLFVLAHAAPGRAWEIHAVAADAAWVTSTPSLDATRDLGSVEWRPEPSTLLAEGPHAAALVSDLVDRAAVVTGAQLLGLADRMITMAVDYAKARHQFGRPIGSYQAVQHPLADARVRLEFARPAVYRAADSLTRDLPDRSAHASMAKALASDAADIAARVALQVHGAIGYTWECDLHLYMKRAWVQSAAWGDAAAHRARVLAAALDRKPG
jgi:alkylation response protein AidB-like acyl-CoA dehydrogenase